MKKVKFASAMLVSSALLLVSCKPKIQDLCDCAKKSANDFMLRGEYPEPMTKVAIPCAELADKFDKNSSEYQTNVTTLESEIRDSVENKGLFFVDGEMPKFPTISLTHEELRADFGKSFKAARYKYWKTHLIIDDVNFLRVHPDHPELIGFAGKLEGSILKMYSPPTIWIEAKNSDLPESSSDEYSLVDLKTKKVIAHIESTPENGSDAKKYHLIFEFLRAYEKSDLDQAAYLYRALSSQYPDVTQDLLAGNYLRVKSVPAVCKIEGDCAVVESTVAGAVIRLNNAKYIVQSKLDIAALKPIPVKNFDPSKFNSSEENADNSWESTLEQQ